MAMNRKARRAAKVSNKAGGANGVAQAKGRALLGDAVASLNRGDAVAAAGAAQAALADNPSSAEAHYLLGTAELLQGQDGEAERCYRRAIALAPRLAEAHNNLGTILERRGQLDAAMRCYGDALAARPDYAEAHNNLGNVHARENRADEAVAAFHAAVAARPVYPEAWYNLANALAQAGQGERAEDAYRQALTQRPGFVEALNNLSVLLVGLGRAAEAEAASRQAVRLDPRAPQSHYNLGDALRELGRANDALGAYRQTLALKPDDAAARIAIGNILLGQDRRDEALVMFGEAQRLRPISARTAAKTPADFSALLLIAPGAANTPVDFLIDRAVFDSHIVALLPGVDYDLALLRGKADVVVNLISDVDRHEGLLPVAADLVERLGRPTVNPPRRIAVTGRDAIAARLSGIARCRVPRTARFTAASLIDPERALADFPAPLLIRPAGVHGGEAFELLDGPGAVAGFVARHPAVAYYLTEFVDFRSADGQFRKFRLIFVDGQILPYHLAIHDGWKVHHMHTDMAAQDWKRREEAAFLEDPARVFDAGHMEALRAIRDAIGLDYFGIDCALDRDGRILVFEVNATMLVHGEAGIFAYKQPHILRIKDAFAAMLAKAARGPAPPA